MLPSVNNQIVLITGANQGIGWEAAKALVSSSADVHVIVGSRSIDKGENAIAEIKAEGAKGSLSVVQLDVTDDISIASAAKQVAQEFGRLDALCNNAGAVFSKGPLRELIGKTFDTNTAGAAVVTDAFVELLKKSPNPRLVHVSSEVGSITRKLDPSIWHSKLPALSYRMSKTAMNMLGAYHTVHLAEFGIKVFTWNPGYTITNLSGEDQRETRRQNGAHTADVPGKGLAEIITGARDSEAGQFLDVTEGLIPW